jgi:hypothetical protein
LRFLDCEPEPVIFFGLVATFQNSATFWTVMTSGSFFFMSLSIALIATGCMEWEGCTERSRMFVSIRVGIYPRSGFILARVMASSGSGGVSR